MLTICYQVAGYINIVIQAAVSIPAVVQIIWVGIYRWSWYGNACSFETNTLYTQGIFLRDMFVAQISLFIVYHFYALAGTKFTK